MLDIKFYKTNSPKNKIGKTLTSVGTYSCALKENTSVLRPRIILQTSDNIYTANYLEISAFNRKYFIDDIVSAGYNRWEVSAHVDVLETYKSQILSNTAILERQTNYFNTYLNDDEWPVYSYNDVITFAFTSSDFKKEAAYILTVAGGA